MAVILETRSDIPVPTIRTKYPWLTMEVGESFAFPLTIKAESSWTITSSANRNYAPRQFMTRKLNGEIRCWRVA